MSNGNQNNSPQHEENLAPTASPETVDEGGGGGAQGAAEEQLLGPDLANLKAKAAKADENWDKLLRLNADFDNFKKRAARERQDGIRFANEALLEKLIPILDNFDMALTAATSAQTGNNEALKTGVNMILTQLRSVVADAGLEEIIAAGQAFDPNLHEAVSQQETTEVPEGRVLQQLRKGYKLKDRLLRPATVVVAKAPAR